MTLTDNQKIFIQREFELSSEALLKMNTEELQSLREACFDIEVEEAANADNNGTDISERGDIAAELVGVTLSMLKLSMVEAV